MWGIKKQQLQQQAKHLLAKRRKTQREAVMDRWQLGLKSGHFILEMWFPHLTGFELNAPPFIRASWERDNLLTPCRSQSSWQIKPRQPQGVFLSLPVGKLLGKSRSLIAYRLSYSNHQFLPWLYLIRSGQCFQPLWAVLLNCADLQSFLEITQPSKIWSGLLNLRWPHFILQG